MPEDRVIAFSSRHIIFFYYFVSIFHFGKYMVIKNKVPKLCTKFQEDWTNLESDSKIYFTQTAKRYYKSNKN